jgi:hypothetical protein
MAAATLHSKIHWILKPVAASVIAMAAACAGLPTFGSDLGKTEMAGQEVRPPYTSVISYFGFIQPGQEPDETVDGKKMYYLYIWVPAVAPEIGVRMMSPVKGMAEPGKGDFVDPNYMANKDSADYFDTWVRFERCLAAVNPEDITKPCEQWVSFGENDDSSELPAQPSGSKYNSVLRLATSADDPMKALVRGMYRVGFTTYKVGDVKGTFLAQVGAPVELPGTAIARNPADLAKALAPAPAEGAAPASSNAGSTSSSASAR